MTLDFEDLANTPAPLPESSLRAEPGTILKRLSARHHKLAQCLAEGMKPGDAGLVCGYTAARVSVLQTDKAFKDLVGFYAAQVQQTFLGTAQKLAGVADTALDILQDRLEDEPDKFTTPQLLSVITTAADRSGHGPQSTQRNITVTLGASEIAAIKARALQSQAGSVKLLPSQQGGTLLDSGKAPEPAQAQEGERPEGPPLREGGHEGPEDLDPPG